MPSPGSGTVVAEYAATNATTNRVVQCVNGEMVPVFSGNIPYSRLDYLTQNSKRIALVTTAQGGPGMPQNQDAYGNVYVSPEELAADLASDAALYTAFNTVADYYDAKIKADLIKRGIIPSVAV
jgi:hypothetical protein